MELDENIAIFTEGEFSTQSTLKDGSDLLGIFDNSPDTSFDEFGTPIQSRKISFLVETAKANVLLGDYIKIENRNYKIIEVLPDGKLTRLILKDAA